MKTFNDNAGRTWTIAVNVDAVKRVRDLLGEDLLDVKQILERLTIDPILLCDVVYSSASRGPTPRGSPTRSLPE